MGFSGQWFLFFWSTLIELSGVATLQKAYKSGNYDPGKIFLKNHENYKNPNWSPIWGTCNPCMLLLFLSVLFTILVHWDLFVLFGVFWWCFFMCFFFFKKKLQRLWREHVDWSNPRRDWQLGFFIPSVIFFRLLFVW